jgi:H+/Cl- antiporter ClcA
VSILAILVYLICLGILYAVGNLVIDKFFPEPPNSYLKLALIILICLAVVVLLLSLVGVGPGLNLKIV